MTATPFGCMLLSLLLSLSSLALANTPDPTQSSFDTGIGVSPANMTVSPVNTYVYTGILRDNTGAPVADFPADQAVLDFSSCGNPSTRPSDLIQADGPSDANGVIVWSDNLTFGGADPCGVSVVIASDLFFVIGSGVRSPDEDGDGDIDVIDCLILREALKVGSPLWQGDLNLDGTISIFDLAFFAEHGPGVSCSSPDPAQSSFDTGIGVSPANMTVSPSNKYVYTATLRDNTGAPVVGFPADQAVLDFAGCFNPSTRPSDLIQADGPSDANGVIVWSDNLTFGGADPCGVSVVIASDPFFVIGGGGLRSPDEDGDGDIDVIDCLIFREALESGSPLWQGDLNLDGTISIFDLAFFAEHGPGVSCSSPDPAQSSFDTRIGVSPANMTVSPSNTYVYAATLRDDTGAPVVGFPADQAVLDFGGCFNPSTRPSDLIQADGPSDANGVIVWSDNLTFGGADPCAVSVVIASDLFFVIEGDSPGGVRSPDEDGDGDIDATDCQILHDAFNSGSPLWQGDLNLDDAITLQDIQFFGAHGGPINCSIPDSVTSLPTFSPCIRTSPVNASRQSPVDQFTYSFRLLDSDGDPVADYPAANIELEFFSREGVDFPCNPVIVSPSAPSGPLGEVVFTKEDLHIETGACEGDSNDLTDYVAEIRVADLISYRFRYVRSPDGNSGRSVESIDLALFQAVFGDTLDPHIGDLNCSGDFTTSTLEDFAIFQAHFRKADPDPATSSFDARIGVSPANMTVSPPDAYVYTATLRDNTGAPVSGLPPRRAVLNFTSCTNPSTRPSDLIEADAPSDTNGVIVWSDNLTFGGADPCAVSVEIDSEVFFVIEGAGSDVAGGVRSPDVDGDGDIDPTDCVTIQTAILAGSPLWVGDLNLDDAMSPLDLAVFQTHGGSCTLPLGYDPVTKSDHAGNEGEGSPPAVFALHAARPNPFSTTTTITFELPEAREVRLVIYDATGRQVRSLVDGGREAGVYRAAWDGKTESGNRAARGVYFARIEAGAFKATQRVVVLR